MKRRQFLFAVTAFTLMGTMTARADHEDDILEWLTEQGYRPVDVSRTLMGRVRILAVKGTTRRELVINPRTGEILRDVLTTADGETHQARADDGKGSQQDSGQGSSNPSGHDGGDSHTSGGDDAGDDGEDSSGSGDDGGDDSGSKGGDGDGDD